MLDAGDTRFNKTRSLPLRNLQITQEDKLANKCYYRAMHKVLWEHRESELSGKAWILKDKVSGMEGMCRTNNSCGFDSVWVHV